MDLSWFKNKKVTVMGLGFHGGGLGVTRWLCGLEAQVTVTDIGTEEKLKDSLEAIKDLPITLVLGKHNEEDFSYSDMVIRNPAIPQNSRYLSIARDHGVPIEMETGLFFRFSPTRNIVAITGTKGKTTTAHLMHHTLQQAGYPVKLAGNMGKSMVELLDQLTPLDWLVFEISSFQCEGFESHIDEFRSLHIGPNYAILTNLFEDHLNRYGSMHDYALAKKLLFMIQSEQQHSFFRRGDMWKDFFIDGLIGDIHLVDAQREAPLAHYQHGENAALVRACARQIGIADEIIDQAFSSFTPPEHRLEFVRELQGVSFYNDSTATNPTSAANGIRELSKQGRPIVAIIGGNDKEMDFLPLIHAITTTHAKFVLLEGTADKKLSELPHELLIGAFKDYRKAIEAAFESARPNGIVTLSPGATSFNMFKDEFDRGNQFKAIVNSL